jgi:hypothetical protein
MMIMRRPTNRMVHPEIVMAMAVLVSLAHGKRENWSMDDIAVATDEEEGSHRQIRSLRDSSPRKLKTENLLATTTPTLRPTLPRVEEKKIINTTLKSSVSYAGNMFDILAKDDIVITSIAFNTPVETDYISVQLYTREGSYKGYDKDISKWTLQADVAVQGKGLDNLTFIPEGAFDPIFVRHKETLAIYITTDRPNLRVDKGAKEGKKVAANSDIVIYEGVGKRYPIDKATFSSRIWNGAIQYDVVDLPTLSPTLAELDTVEPSSRPTKQPEIDAFRLRLYWQKGYMWQGISDEMWWCMECRDSCLDGDSVYVDYCDSSISQKFTFVGDTIRPQSDTSLCLTTMGFTQETPMRYFPCNGHSDQSFEGLTTSGRFELHPMGESDRCVSQNHHPKPFERVYPEYCSLTRIHDTNYWIAF